MSKFKLLGLLIALFSITTFTSCEKEEESWVGPLDVSPVRFSFYLLDEDSTNLLNDSINRELFMDKVKVIYKNREYRCSEVIDSLYYWGSKESRATLVKFNGLRIEQTIPSSSKYPYIFTFGDFHGNKDHSEISFIIDWGDGTSDKIYLKYDYKRPKVLPVWDYEFYVNDELKSNGKGVNSFFTNYTFIKELR